jgi:hypothetical protein
LRCGGIFIYSFDKSVRQGKETAAELGAYEASNRLRWQDMRVAYPHSLRRSSETALCSMETKTKAEHRFRLLFASLLFLSLKLRYLGAALYIRLFQLV